MKRSVIIYYKGKLVVVKQRATYSLHIISIVRSFQISLLFEMDVLVEPHILMCGHVADLRLRQSSRGVIVRQVLRIHVTEGSLASKLLLVCRVRQVRICTRQCVRRKIVLEYPLMVLLEVLFSEAIVARSLGLLGIDVHGQEAKV